MTSQNGLLIFLGKETHSETKSCKSSRIFNEKSYNNNGKPWKSSRILRVNPMFSFFFFFNHFSPFFLFFSFFHFFIFSIFRIFSCFPFFHFFHFSHLFMFFSFSLLFCFLFFQFFLFFCFSIFFHLRFVVLLLFPVVRADAKTSKKNRPEVPIVKKRRFPFVKIRFLGLGGQRVRRGPFEGDFAFMFFLFFFFSWVLKVCFFFF